MKRILIAPHGPSNGAKALASGTGGKVTKATKILKRDVLLVNWGRSELNPRGYARVINPPNAVQIASNKLSCLEVMRREQVPHVPYTTSAEVARRWIVEGSTVYGRKLLNSSQGNGIIIITDPQMVGGCPLYTKGILKAHEYRVHVINGKIVDVTKKRRRNDAESNDFIKNLENGWVYCRENIEIPKVLTDAAKTAVKAAGLDFGAVDLLYSKGVPYVLEINTAPGLEGTTLEKYVQEFNNMKRF